MSITTNKWVLLAGGPNSGKTTLTNYLGEQGYAIKAEQARSVLDNYIQRGVDFSAITGDPAIGAAFQEEIARKELAVEAELDPKTLTFFDRSCIEYMGFLTLRGLPPNVEILEAISKKTYGLCIILDVIPTAFAANKLESTLEDPVAESIRQADALLAAVATTHTPIVRLPASPIEQRAAEVIALCRAHGLLAEGSS